MNATSHYATAEHSHYDIIIVGGAIIGSSIAWFTSKHPDYDGRILVIEQDPTYEFAATSRTNSCVRQQFSTEINIQISQFTADFVKNFRHYIGQKEAPELAFDMFGYMYLAATKPFAEHLSSIQNLQAKLGAGTQIMSPDAIAEAYPFYHLDDILLGSHNLVDEGYFEGSALFEWWRRMAQKQGVEYLHNQLVDIEISADEHSVTAVRLASGERIECKRLINAAGTRANIISHMAGISLPIEPRKRFTWIFSAERPLDRALPLTIDPSGIHLRQYGANASNLYMAGSPPDPDPAVDFDDFDEHPSLWEDHVWPLIAHRIPQFDALRIESSWAGHYDFNYFDHNAVVGPHPELSNFFFANGFSGHGLQQSPAIGRGLSELLIEGRYQTLDLSCFSYQRISDGTPLREAAVI